MVNLDQVNDAQSDDVRVEKLGFVGLLRERFSFWQRHGSRSDATQRLTIAPNAIQQVAFFKRDEIAKDLICCEIVAGDAAIQTWFFHEEAPEWPNVLELVQRLAGFDSEALESNAATIYRELDDRLRA